MVQSKIAAALGLTGLGILTAPVMFLPSLGASIIRGVLGGTKLALEWTTFGYLSYRFFFDPPKILENKVNKMKTNAREGFSHTMHWYYAQLADCSHTFEKQQTKWKKDD